MGSKWMSWASTTAAVLLSVGADARAQSVSRQPPPAYEAHLRPWLTPLGEALKLRAKRTDDGESVVLLLREVLRRVEDDGRIVMAVHQIHEARTADGAEALSRAVSAFQKSRQRIHLVLARSIQPDGSEQPVLAEAAFLQSPQREAEKAIYSDVGELVLVFPRVLPKTVTESIVVIEDQEPLVAGELTTVLIPESRWPARRVRYAIDLSSKMAERLRTTPLGASVPEPTRTPGPGKRTRLSWEWPGLASSPPEPNPAPSDQVGPAIWLSTLRDWDAFGRWYEQVLKDRGELGAALSAQVDEWTRGQSSPEQVLATLFRKVAREVRYTGLEFGIAAIRPHEPREVWANRYGDCKDKSNLLVAMLRHKGIPARLALLNSEHAGRIERSMPAPQQFDHAIVAIRRPEGGWIFCDPTIGFARPGLLSPADADRAALLVGAGEPAELVQTPPQDAGALDYTFDVALQPDGALSGWMTVDAKEYYATWFAENYADQSPELQRERLQGLASHFFRGAQLIDYEPVKVSDLEKGTRLRAYVTVPGAGAGPEEKQSLSFPPIEALRPNLGDRPNRRTSYWQWQGTRTLNVHYKLPPGFQASTVPRPFAIETPAAVIEARWESGPASLGARMLFRARQSAVSLEGFALLHGAFRSLDAWLKAPIEVGPGHAGVAASAPPAEAGLDAADFPLMPSGAGQCELAEQRFPLESSPALRREAFRRVLQWFPSDKKTSFRARMRLVEIDLEAAPKDAKDLGTAKRLVAAAKGDLPPEIVAWGDFMLGTWLARAGERSEALAIFTRLVADAGLSEYRRAWSAVEAATLQLDQAPADAESTLRSTLALLPESAPAQYRLLADALLRQGKGEALSKILLQSAEAHLGNGDKIFEGLAELSEELLTRGRREDALALGQRLIEAGQGKPVLQTAAAKAKAVLDQAGAMALYQEIARELKRRIETQPPAWWQGAALPEKAETREQLRGAIEERGNAWRPDSRLRGLLELLTRFAPDPSKFPNDLWTALSTVEPRVDDGALFEALASQCARLPAKELIRYECEITSAKRQARQGASAAALAVYRRLGDDAGAPSAIRQAALRLSGELYEEKGELGRALATYAEIKGDPELTTRSCNGLLRAAFIALELGKPEQAIALIQRLGKVRHEVLKEAESAGQIKDLVALEKAGRAPKFWARQEKWWPSWLKIEAKVGLAPLKDNVEIPILPDLYELGRRFGNALRDKDRNEGFMILRTMAHAARWDPSIPVEMAGVIAMSGSVASERTQDLRLMVIEMLADLDTGDAQTTRRGQILFAANLVDAGRTAQAHDLAVSYLEKNPADDALRAAMVRLWAMAAMAEKRPLEPIAAELKRVLDTSMDPSTRGITVTSLANVFSQMGRVDEEIALLQREESNEDVRADTENHRSIQGLLKALTAGRESSAKLSQSVARWRAGHQPPWFDFVLPKALDAATEERLDETLKHPPVKMLLAERVKLGLLVAESQGQPYPRKTRALDMAIRALDQLAQRHSDAAEMYRSFYDDPSFDAALRSRWLWMSLFGRASAEQDVTALVSHPLAASFSGVQKQLIAQYNEWAAVDRSSVPALRDYAEKLIKGPSSLVRFDLLYKVVGRLANLGAFDAAQELVARFGSVATGDDGQQDPASMQLELLAWLRKEQRASPVRRRLREVLLAAGPRNAAAPAELADLRHPAQLAYEDPKLALRIRLALLARGEPEVMDDVGFAALAGGLDSRHALGLSLFSEAAKAAEGDAERFPFVDLGARVVDVDDPGERREMLSVLQPYRRLDASSATRAEIQELDLFVALRTGDWVALAGATSAVEASGDPRAKLMAAWARVVHGMAVEDVPAVRGALEKVPAQALLEPSTMPWVLRALEFSGMKDQAQIVLGRAREELYRLAVRSWSGPARGDVEHTLALAEAMGQPELLPARLLSDLQGSIREPQSRRRVALFVARQAKDWKRVAAIADESIKEVPQYYEAYWWRADALMKLGRKREAVPALERFVRYCNDDLDHREAAKLLRELRSH